MVHERVDCSKYSYASLCEGVEVVWASAVAVIYYLYPLVEPLKARLSGYALRRLLIVKLVFVSSVMVVWSFERAVIHHSYSRVASYQALVAVGVGVTCHVLLLLWLSWCTSASAVSSVARLACSRGAGVVWASAVAVIYYLYPLVESFKARLSCLGVGCYGAIARAVSLAVLTCGNCVVFASGLLCSLLVLSC